MIKRTFVQNVFVFLKYKLSYIKYYLPFMFLHKPLCERYKNSSVCLFNKLYVCRSCLCLYSGMVLGLIFALNYTAGLRYALILFVISAILSYPKLYSLYARTLKDILRFSVGFFVIVLIIAVLKYNLFSLLILICFLFLIKKYYNSIRKNRDLCEDCSEQFRLKSCSGYRFQTEAMLKIEEEVSNFLMKITERSKYD